MGRIKFTRTVVVKLEVLLLFGQGAVASSSNKITCNTKSSTETELILFANQLADIIWMRYFIECQGYDIDKYVVFQDNMSVLFAREEQMYIILKMYQTYQSQIFPYQRLL